MSRIRIPCKGLGRAISQTRAKICKKENGREPVCNILFVEKWTGVMTTPCKKSRTVNKGIEKGAEVLVGNKGQKGQAQFEDRRLVAGATGAIGPLRLPSHLPCCPVQAGPRTWPPICRPTLVLTGPLLKNRRLSTKQAAVSQLGN